MAYFSFTLRLHPKETALQTHMLYKHKFNWNFIEISLPAFKSVCFPHFFSLYSEFINHALVCTFIIVMK